MRKTLLAIDAARVALLIQELGASPRAVSLASFGHPDGVRFILSGKQHRTDEETANKLAAILKCSVEYLTGESDERGSAPFELELAPIERKTRTKTLKSLMQVPAVIGSASFTQIPEFDIRISAGGGSVIETENVRRFWNLPDSYVQSLGVGQRLAFVEIVGDSMAPTLQSGDLVLLDLDSTNPTTPAIYAIFDGGATVCKRIERILRSDPATLRLISDNPLYQSYEVPAEWAHIIGRVAWCARKV